MPVEEPSVLGPPVAWLRLAPECPLVQEGYPDIAPALLHDASIQDLMSSANNILWDLAPDSSSDVILTHDPEWTDFPEVGEALRVAGYEEVSLCIATCATQGKWAVGLCNRQKHRTQAARLALCVALAANADNLAEVCSKHPGFAELCATAEINMDDIPGVQREPQRPNRPPPAMAASAAGHGQGLPASKRRRLPPPPDAEAAALAALEAELDGFAQPVENDLFDDAEAEAAALAAEAEAEAAALAEAEGDEDAQAEAAALAAEAEAEVAALEAEAAGFDDMDFAAKEGPASRKGGSEVKVAKAPAWPSKKPAAEQWPAKAPKAPQEAQVPLPRESPFWIEVPEGEPIPDQLQELAPEALVLCTDGGRKALYAQADSALSSVFGEEAKAIEFVDDANWDLLPAVGAALKLLASKEECFTVAICASRALWAVGVGMKGQNRYKAAKIAMASVGALQLAEIGEDLPDLSELQAFADFVEEARQSKEEMLLRGGF